MYRRLAIEYILFNFLSRVIIFAFGAALIIIVATTITPLFFQYTIPWSVRWQLVLAGVIVGCLLGLSLDLHNDLRVFSTLYRVKQKSSKFFASKDTVVANQYVQVSQDGTHQIRLTRDDAMHFEHCHFEILDPIHRITVENYVYGNAKKINETIWHHINSHNISRQIAFREASKVSNKVKHISCKWSETVENAGIGFPSAEILLILEMGLGAYLFRFSKDLYYGGDTWHQTVKDAKMQAEYEFGIEYNVWHIVPDNIDNMIKFFADQKRKQDSIRSDVLS